MKDAYEAGKCDAVIFLMESTKESLEKLIPNLQTQEDLKKAGSMLDHAEGINIAVGDQRELYDKALEKFQAEDYKAAKNYAETVANDINTGLVDLTTTFIEWAKEKTKALDEMGFASDELNDAIGNASDAVGRDEHFEALNEMLMIKAELQRLLGELDTLKRGATIFQERFDEEREEFEENKDKYHEAGRSLIEYHIDIGSQTLSELDEAVTENDWEKCREVSTSVEGFLDNLSQYKTVSKQLYDAEQDIFDLEAGRFDISEPKASFDAAVEALKREDFDEAQRLAEEICTLTQSSKKLLNAEELIMTADEMLKLMEIQDIDTGELRDNLEQIQNMLAQNEGKDAISLLEETNNKIQELAKEHIDDINAGAMQRLQEAQKVVNADDAEMMFFNAQTALENEDYETALETFTQFGRELARSLEGGEADISIKFENDTLKPNAWSREKIFVKNDGTVHAKNVELDISGPVQVMRLNPIGLLPANGQVSMEIAIHFKGAGSVPLDITAKYNNALTDEEETSRVQLWVDVGS